MKLTTFALLCLALLYFVSIQASTMGNSNNFNDSRKMKCRLESAKKKERKHAVANLKKRDAIAGRQMACCKRKAEADNRASAAKV